MRTILNSEINSVTGAGYSEDITTAAATIYVGSAIGSVVSAFSSAAFSSVANYAGTANGMEPLVSAMGAIGTTVSRTLYFVAPVVVFDAAHPGVIAAKAEEHFS